MLLLLNGDYVSNVRLAAVVHFDFGMWPRIGEYGRERFLIDRRNMLAAKTVRSSGFAMPAPAMVLNTTLASLSPAVETSSLMRPIVCPSMMVMPLISADRIALVTLKATLFLITLVISFVLRSRSWSMLKAASAASAAGIEWVGTTRTVFPVSASTWFASMTMFRLLGRRMMSLASRDSTALSTSPGSIVWTCTLSMVSSPTITAEFPIAAIAARLTSGSISLPKTMKFVQ